MKIHMNRIFRIFAYVLAGIAGAFAYPPVSSFRPWIAVAAQSLWLSYMLAQIDGADSRRRAFMRAWGLVSLANLISLSWITNAFQFAEKYIEAIGPLAFILFCVFWASFSGFVGAGTYMAPQKKRYIAFAVIFSLVEWCRNWIFSGFPWNPASLVWSGVPEMYQVSSLIGTFGLTFITVFLLAAPYLAYKEGGKFLGGRTFRAILAVAAANLAFGAYNIKRVERIATGSGFKVRLVGANIRQSFRRRDFSDIVEYIKLSRLKGWGDADLIVWPETAVHERIYPGDDMTKLLAGVNNGRSHLVAGYDRIDAITIGQYDIYNSMAFINSDDIADIYDKRKLVPFGEYMPPFMKVIPFVKKFTAGPKDFSAGREDKRIALGQMVAVPLICYEIIFPGLRLGEDADFILNVLNEEWFTGLEKFQSLDMSRMRAVEEGVPVVRAANMGISAVISPSGRLVTGDKVFADGSGERADALMEKAVLDVEVPKRIGRTLFSITGNWLVVGLLIAGMLWVFWPVKMLAFARKGKKRRK